MEGAMIKHFCEHCGKEIPAHAERFAAEIKIRAGLPRLERDVEYHIDCVDKVFGEGFSAGIIAENEERIRAINERRAAREATRKTAIANEQRN